MSRKMGVEIFALSITDNGKELDKCKQGIALDYGDYMKLMEYLWMNTKSTPEHLRGLHSDVCDRAIQNFQHLKESDVIETLIKDKEKRDCPEKDRK